MKIRVREIHLSWRKGKGSRRKIVGVLRRTATNGITFRYLKDGCEEAKKDGFNEYPGFSLKYDVVYKEDDLDIFSLRLISNDRKDNLKLLKFWEAEGVNDKFDLLALTQGLLPTDNFEFLGLFNPAKGFKFVTDLAGLSHIELERGIIAIGDKLTYEFEYSEKAYSKKAVKVFKNDIHVGYIKNIHNNIFLKLTPNTFSLTVKDIEQNGIIKNIFVLVNCNK